MSKGRRAKPLHHLRYTPQCLIAGLMTVSVVVGLEMVDIDQQECQRTTIAKRLLPHTRKVVIERATVF